VRESPTKAIQSVFSNISIVERKNEVEVEKKKTKWNKNTTLNDLIAHCPEEELNITIPGWEINMKRIR
jgi:hypothetical protein